MDDKSWNDYLLGNAGVRTGSIMNEVGLQSAYRPPPIPQPAAPGRVYAPRSQQPQYVLQPRPLTEEEKKRREKAKERQARIDALPSTAVYWRWWRLFSALEDRVSKIGRYVLLGSIIASMSSFVVGVVWNGTDWEEAAIVGVFFSALVFVIALYTIYIARILEQRGANPIRTWIGLADFGKWAVPFRVVYASWQTGLLSVLLLWPPVVLWFAGRWFSWW